MRIYIGLDPRSPVAYNVLQWSIIRRSSKPVAIIPLVLPTLPMTRRGLTDFTFSRYLPPALCGYQGTSLFLDPDMLMLGDVVELFDLMDGEHSVYVVKGKERFEWPSLMLFNNEQCKELTPAYIDDANHMPQDLSWAESVGELPREWNFCVGYDEAKELPKLVHYTAGIPHFAETRACDYSAEWWDEYESMKGNCSWLELMGDSVHAEMVLNGLQKRKNEWSKRH
jgi:lipopolysaccharide biosynthesis glycosyltransferase